MLARLSPARWCRSLGVVRRLPARRPRRRAAALAARSRSTATRVAFWLEIGLLRRRRSCCSPRRAQRRDLGDLVPRGDAADARRRALPLQHLPRRASGRAHNWSYFPSVPELLITFGLVAARDRRSTSSIVKTFPILGGAPQRRPRKDRGQPCRHESSSTRSRASRGTCASTSRSTAARSRTPGPRARCAAGSRRSCSAATRARRGSSRSASAASARRCTRSPRCAPSRTRSASRSRSTPSTSAT